MTATTNAVHADLIPLLIAIRNGDAMAAFALTDLAKEANDSDLNHWLEETFKGRGKTIRQFVIHLVHRRRLTEAQMRQWGQAFPG